MLGIYDSLKKLIDKCDLYFDGHIISKELLVKNYADFLPRYTLTARQRKKFLKLLILLRR